MTVKLTFIQRTGKDIIFLIEGGKYNGQHIWLYISGAMGTAEFFSKNHGDTSIITTDGNLDSFRHLMKPC